MNFTKKWGVEIATGAIALWTALGSSGQDGLLNFASTKLLAWHGAPAVVLTVGSIVIARLRPAPSSK